MEQGKFGHRTIGDTAENVVCSKPCYVYNLSPELTTTGTITLRDSATAAGATPKHVCAIGLTQAGKDLGGVLFERGLTVQLSVASDLTLIAFRPA